MAEKPREVENEEVKTPEQKVSDAVDVLEEEEKEKEEESSGLLANVKKFWKNEESIGSNESGKGFAMLSLMSIIAALKLIEVSAAVLQGVVENPENPTKWFSHVKETFKKGKDKK
jgi:hypothetical protein